MGKVFKGPQKMTEPIIPEQEWPQSAINSLNMMRNSCNLFTAPWMTSRDHANTIKILTERLKDEIKLYREAVAKEEIPYDNGIDISEMPWNQLSPEEKAAIMFPDMSTLPLNEKEKLHIIEMFEMNDLQNG